MGCVRQHGTATSLNSMKPILSIAGIALASVVLWYARPQDVGEHYGLWSLLPATITIVACFITRNVLLALILGIFSGG